MLSQTEQWRTVVGAAARAGVGATATAAGGPKLSGIAQGARHCGQSDWPRRCSSIWQLKQTEWPHSFFTDVFISPKHTGQGSVAAAATASAKVCAAIIASIPTPRGVGHSIFDAELAEVRKFFFWSETITLRTKLISN